MTRGLPEMLDQGGVIMECPSCKGKGTIVQRYSPTRRIRPHIITCPMCCGIGSLADTPPVPKEPLAKRLNAVLHAARRVVAADVEVKIYDPTAYAPASEIEGAKEAYEALEALRKAVEAL